MIIDLIRCTDLLKVSFTHHSDPVRHVNSLFLVMGNIDKRYTQLFLKTLQFCLHSPTKLQIQCP